MFLDYFVLKSFDTLDTAWMKQGLVFRLIFVNFLLMHIHIQKINDQKYDMSEIFSLRL